MIEGIGRLSQTFSGRRGRIVTALGVIALAFLGIRIGSDRNPFDASYSTVLYDRDGTLLGATISEDQQWRFPFSQTIPARYEACVLAFEDQYFYYHPGFNPVSIIRSLVYNVRHGKKRGGSTLTQQLIRLSRENPNRTYGEKIIELLYAIKIELTHSKQDILNLYAAHAPFGGNVVGIDAASWRYFGRDASQLSWAEYALLAVLPNSPSLLFPGKNHPLLLRKRNLLLKRLLDQGTISQSTYDLSLLEPLPKRPKPLPQIAPHLLQTVIGEGKAGQHIVTSIRTDWQRQLNRTLTRHHHRLQQNSIDNLAALIIDIRTGEAQAYVGNIPHSKRSPHVDIIHANRSTGSTLKPFLYAAMLESGDLLPQQLVPDIPMFFDGFTPQNFDRDFRGMIPANVALVRSLNLPSVSMLRRYTYPKFHLKLKELGMYSLTHDANHYGLSIILGGAETSLWEITSMYASMARALRTSEKVRGYPLRYNSRDYRPNQYTLSPPPEPDWSTVTPISPAAIWTTFETMKGLASPWTHQGWANFASNPNLAWKTGTSFGFKDAWAIGVTSKHVVGVWVGNADGEGRADLTGVKAAAPVLFDIVDGLPQSKWFAKPQLEMQTIEICTRSGMRKTRFCPHSKAQDVPKSIKPAAFCTFHKQIAIDKEGTHRVNTLCYPVQKLQTQSVFVLPLVEEWYYRQKHIDYKGMPPWHKDCLSYRETSPLKFIYPKPKSTVYIPKNLDQSLSQMVAKVAHRDRDATLYWHLDNRYLGQTARTHKMPIYIGKGQHTLRVIDAHGKSSTIVFKALNP